MGVRVVTDSACDLPDDLIERLGIEVVPLTIRFGDEELIDRKELTTGEFWRRLESSPELPETAAPSPGAFEQTFRRLVDDGATGIVCINLSSKLSGTMQSAEVAAKALEGTCPVTVVDSLQVSMGLGNLALTAARLAADGDGLDSIVADVLERRSRTKLFGTLDTLEYLKKGGRVGNARALLGSMLADQARRRGEGRLRRGVGQGPHPLEGAEAPRRPGARAPADREPGGARRRRARPRPAPRAPRPPRSHATRSSPGRSGR